MPSDKDYKETKQIMSGNTKMKSEFRELADWIDKTFNVKTINIIYDTINNGTQPRLEICFEFEKEKVKFKSKNGLTYDSEKQIGLKLEEILEEKRILENEEIFSVVKKSNTLKYKTENIWIIYGAFEPIAKIEATQNISQDDIIKLKEKLNNKDIWKISNALSRTTFFLYTDKQLKKYKNSKELKKWEDNYFELLKLYDEFGYFKRDDFKIYLDSKENFDANYQSNWYYYYK